MSVHKITVGDTLTPLGVQLVQPDENGSLAPVNLTGLTVKFIMTDETGALVVEETDTGVTVVTAASGLVEYQFADADVAAAGVYDAWFRTYSGTKFDTYPCDGSSFKIKIIDVIPVAVP